MATRSATTPSACVDVAAEASAIGLSTAIAGTLDPARSTASTSSKPRPANATSSTASATAAATTDTTYRLIDPERQSQAWGSYGWMEDRDVAAFAQTGTYLLLVEGRIGNALTPKTYSFNIQKVSDLQATLDLGSTVAGTIDHVGQRAVYSFSLTEARQLLFDALAPNNNQPDFRWSLIGPRGAEVNGRQLYYSESHELGSTSPLLDLIAGDYQLIIDPINEQRGSFAFRLLDLADATQIEANTLVAGTLAPANQTQAYRFDASAGIDYYIDRQCLSSGVGADWLTWRLFDSYGRQIFGPQNLNDVDLFTLPHDGAYTLLVEGRIWDTQYTSRHRLQLQAAGDHRRRLRHRARRVLRRRPQLHRRQDRRRGGAEQPARTGGGQQRGHQPDRLDDASRPGSVPTTCRPPGRRWSTRATATAASAATACG